MKRKDFIAVGAIVLIAVIALVVLMLEKNNSEFRIQNSELNVSAEPASIASGATETASPDSEPQVTPDVIEVEQTEAPAVETETSTAAETEKTDVGETEAPTEEETANPAEDEAKEQPFLVQITEDDPSIGYVLVRMPNPVGLLPLPTEGEYSRAIRTQMADGSEAVNVLHLTTDGFRMEDANCEGHDCVKQG